MGQNSKQVTHSCVPRSPLYAWIDVTYCKSCYLPKYCFVSYRYYHSSLGICFFCPQFDERQGRPISFFDFLKYLFVFEMIGTFSALCRLKYNCKWWRKAKCPQKNDCPTINHRHPFLHAHLRFEPWLW